MTQATFSQALESLNPSQRRAVETVEGPVMVIAGPGTGKTQVLATRVGQILNTTQVQPENILVLSFTDNAAWQLQQRLVGLMGAVGYRVPVMTFHSWCASLHQRYPDHFEDYLDATMIADVKQAEILEQALTELPLTLIRPPRSPMHYLGSIKTAISTLKREGKTPTELLEATNAAISAIEEAPDLYHTKGRFKGRLKSGYANDLKAWNKTLELAKVFEYYEAYLASHQLMDYDSIILSVVTRLASDSLLVQLLSEQYQYFLVDEHQDTNAAQNRAIILVTGQDPKANVFVVGDDKQAIFRFQGGTIANFLLFPSIFSESSIVQLTDNYRSSQVILDAASAILDTHNATVETLLGVPILPLTARAQRAQLPLRLLACADPTSELLEITRTIEAWLNSGTDSSEIAVISKTNQPLRQLAVLLQSHQIPYYLSDASSVFDDPAVIQLKRLMEAVADLGSDPALAVALAQPCLELDPLEVATLLTSDQVRAEGLWSAIINQSVGLSENLKTTIDRLHEIAKQVSLSKPSQVLIEILVATRLYDWVGNQPTKLEMFESLKVFINRVRELEEQQPDLSLGGLVSIVSKAKEYGLKWTAKQPITRHGVRLLTAHGAKGLEFERVIIMRADSVAWKPDAIRRELLKLPTDHLGLSVPTKDDFNADLERLLYVAITRAKEEVVATYPVSLLGGREVLSSVLLSRFPEALVRHEQSQTVASEQLLGLHTKQHRISQAELADYLSACLTQNSLSVSGLNNFLLCPWTYVFRNLLRLPESRTAVQSYGTAIHDLISKLFRVHKLDDIEYALSLVPASLAKQAMTKDEIARFAPLAEAALTSLVPQVLSKLHPEAKSEVRMRVITNTGIKLTGVLDVIEPVAGSIRVYDFKSGKEPSRGEIEGTGKGSGNYLRQLVFYSLLLKHSHPKKTMEQGVLVFLPPDKDSTKLYQTSIQPSQQDLLMTQIVDLEKQVQSVDFFHKSCPNQDCVYCELASSLFGGF